MLVISVGPAGQPAAFTVPAAFAKKQSTVKLAGIEAGLNWLSSVIDVAA